MTKLKIDLNSGLLEVEGEEGFVKEIYKEYKEKIFPNISIHDSKGEKNGSQAQVSETKLAQIKKASGKSVRKETYSLVKEIQLQALKEFYEQKTPKTGFEKNVVFVYYLQNKLNIANINPNHIYTCYKLMSIPIPKALKQSIVDTYHNKAWIDSSNMNDLTMLTSGENIVEHELPRKE